MAQNVPEMAPNVSGSRAQSTAPRRRAKTSRAAGPLSGWLVRALSHVG